MRDGDLKVLKEIRAILEKSHCDEPEMMYQGVIYLSTYLACGSSIFTKQVAKSNKIR